MRSTDPRSHYRGIEALCDDPVGMGYIMSFGFSGPIYALVPPDGQRHILSDEQFKSITTSRRKSFFSKLDDDWNISETAKKVAPIVLAPLALPAVATAGAIAAPVVAAGTVLAPLAVTGAAAHAAGIATPDEIKHLGEKFNLGDSSSDWKKWAESFAAAATLGISRDEHVRDEVKRLGEKWNVGNNSVDTLKSMANVASIVGALSGVGTLASALLGSSTLTQGALTVAREYARTSLRDKVIGKVGEELADPYIDHLIKKARRDAQALAAEERALVAQYQAQRPGVNSLMLMAVENPNALDREQMQVIVNYQRDNERERAIAENRPDPPEDEWPAYYARFLAEYGVAWQPTEAPGYDRVVGGGLPPQGKTVYLPGTTLEQQMALDRMKENVQGSMLRRSITSYTDIARSSRSQQPLSFSPALKAALDSLYPPTGV